MKVIEGTDLRDGGFGGLWGVGKAATNPPALVVLTFDPANATKTIVWAGKGIGKSRQRAKLAYKTHTHTYSHTHTLLVGFSQTSNSETHRSKPIYSEISTDTQTHTATHILMPFLQIVVCIVYDTGGLSIKGKTAMPGMKRDMVSWD